jgi:hypothetical protein
MSAFDPKRTRCSKRNGLSLQERRLRLWLLLSTGRLDWRGTLTRGAVTSRTCSRLGVPLAICARDDSGDVFQPPGVAEAPRELAFPLPGDKRFVLEEAPFLVGLLDCFMMVTSVKMGTHWFFPAGELQSNLFQPPERGKRFPAPRLRTCRCQLAKPGECPLLAESGNSN